MKTARKKIIFDTTSLISACIYPYREPAKIFLKAISKFDLIASKKTIQEIDSVLKRPKFDKWCTAEYRQAWVKDYVLLAKEFSPSITISDCRDAKDNMFLELAVFAQVEIIISSDDDLLVLNPYKEIEILTLREFSNRFL